MSGRAFAGSLTRGAFWDAFGDGWGPGLAEFSSLARLDGVTALACSPSLGHIDAHGDVAEWLKAAVC
jgi:hypothetical protein